MRQQPKILKWAESLDRSQRLILILFVGWALLILGWAASEIGNSIFVFPWNLYYAGKDLLGRAIYLGLTVSFLLGIRWAMRSPQA